MNANTVGQWKVPSETCCEREYIVSEMADKSWQCSCTGWTRHVPRRDCKHILYDTRPPRKSGVWRKSTFAKPEQYELTFEPESDKSSEP